jgi:hypothetical protein
MNIFVKAIRQRVFDRIETVDVARLPAIYRYAGASVMSRIAAAGILRLAFRWPALSIILIVSVVAARALTGRRHRADGSRPALRAP